MDFLRQSAHVRGVPLNARSLASPGTASSFARAMSSVHSQGDLRNNTADDEDSSFDSSDDSSYDSPAAKHDSIHNLKSVHTERKRINWKIENTMLPKPKPKKPVHTTDWLKQQRNKRLDADGNLGDVPHEHTDLRKELSELDNKTKAKMLDEKAKVMTE